MIACWVRSKTRLEACYGLVLGLRRVDDWLGREREEKRLKGPSFIPFMARLCFQSCLQLSASLAQPSKDKMTPKNLGVAKSDSVEA